jgi:hypothetical protein
MTDLSSLINLVPMDQVAKALGVDEDVARIAVQAAVPTILAGLEHNASNETGAGDLAEAVSTKDPSVLDSLSLDQIDRGDGEKILGHVFGGQQNQVADALGERLGPQLGGAAQPNIGSELVKKLLPILAPIILTYLAQQATQKGGDLNRSNGGLLQEILGGLLSGAAQGAGQGAGRRTSPSTGAVVGDILTQILRGGR